MTRFIRLMLAMNVLLVFCAVLVRIVGSTQPEATVASLFLNPDGTQCTAPCVLGIRPGETAVEQVAAALSAHPVTVNSRAVQTLKNTYLFTPNGNAMSLAFSVESGGEINYVRFSFLAPPQSQRNTGVTLGDVIQAFGAPDFVIDCSTPGLNCSCGYILIFQDAGLEVFISRYGPLEERFRPGYWLSDFIVLRLRVCPDSALYVPTRTWNGFTAISRYSEDAGIKVFYQTTDRMFPIVCGAPQGAT